MKLNAYTWGKEIAAVGKSLNVNIAVWTYNARAGTAILTTTCMASTNLNKTVLLALFGGTILMNISNCRHCSGIQDTVRGSNRSNTVRGSNRPALSKDRNNINLQNESANAVTANTVYKGRRLHINLKHLHNAQHNYVVSCPCKEKSLLLFDIDPHNSNHTIRDSLNKYNEVEYNTGV